MHTSPYHIPISLGALRFVHALYTKHEYAFRLHTCTYLYMRLHTVYIHACVGLYIAGTQGGTQSVQQCLYNACYMDIGTGLLSTFLPVLYSEIVHSTFTHTPQNCPIPLPSHFSLLTNHAITLIETLIENYLTFPTLSRYTWGLI